MEVTFFPSLPGSDLQMSILLPFCISPGIHCPNISKAWTRLALGSSGLSKDPNQEPSLLRLSVVVPIHWRYLPSTSHFKEGESPILAPRNSSVHPSS